MSWTQPGIIIYTDGLNLWVVPNEQPTTGEERARVLDALKVWTKLHRGTVTLATSEDLVRPWEEDEL